ncbi:4-(cytidine 5'-diphospho)-2-C-methyl-D-erythritol kinase [Sphingomonas sp. FW199]|uniref:4-(cytidine 5'-diphospho)-2-C-methyl-D-erythritol kinase n=1 Tax=Sphingomonas sp. FW199 TaxID=3400217 RepID=UPI003CF537F3
MRITEPAPAKINLALHVRARRPDGYHELETLFAFVEAGDVVSVEPAERDEFRICGRFGAALDAESDNLVTRARDRFRAAFGLPAVAIELVKNLPVASGIGGGSADAAATLRALARMTGIGADDARLHDLADGLGSDVPACLFGRTAMGRGRGEQLQPLIGAARRPVLLINPGIAVSTAAVFARWDGVDRGPLRTDDVMEAALDGRNDLYPPARLVAPGIDAPLALLEASPGVVLARMSGSGATCFALFDSEERMLAAAERASIQAGWWVCPTRLRP